MFEKGKLPSKPEEAAAQLQRRAAAAARPAAGVAKEAAAVNATAMRAAQIAFARDKLRMQVENTL